MPPSIGESYERQRTQIRQERSEGMTKTYNRFHDPDDFSSDIQKLRDLHVEMDQAVASAYCWTMSTSNMTSTKPSRVFASRSANRPVEKSSSISSS